MIESRTPSPAALAWAAGIIGDGATVVAAKGMRHGDNPWLLRVEHAGQTVEAVLKTVHPDVSAGLATEIAALGLAARWHLPAPRVLGRDVSGDRAGAPAVLETVVPGRSAIPVEPTRERLRAIGAAAAALRSVTVQPSAELPVRTRPIPVSDFAAARRQGTDRSSALLADADERVARLPMPTGEPGLVHGDFWQGNMMWHGDTLCGLVDWDMAGVGHYGVDLSSVRLDAALMFGIDAAEAVLAGWEEAAGERAENLAYWDAVAAVNQPGDMAMFAPVIQDQGRPDLTDVVLNERRDAFLRAALDRLG